LGWWVKGLIIRKLVFDFANEKNGIVDDDLKD
jgi:hypothetical protein